MKICVQDTFLYGVIVPVIPFSIAERAGVALENVQLWTSLLLAIHGAGLLIASPLCGYVADRLSRRLPYLFGLGSLAAATLM
ncbi:hypothetical protein MW887_003207 [Aspergillus wentii]|nr:hypothetical protein MW887_003207 [Aspergillus wentii]